MKWHPVIQPFGSWSWSTGEFPNGWSALVTDHSQSYAPKRRTEYQVATTCRWWIVSHPRAFETLAEAKDAAVDLAMGQRQASKDSACRVEAVRP